MKFIPLPEQSELLRIFNYCPNTGVVRWKERPRGDFKSDQGWKARNTNYIEAIAGSKGVNKKGNPASITISINKRSYMAHRLIWTMVHGQIPDGKLIDHIDGNPWNNKLENLRVATFAQNSHNMHRCPRNTSGLKGVGWHKKSGKWRATIGLHGELKHLGLFLTPEEAHLAYCEAAKEYHGDFARTTHTKST